jgi:hypothetical protein
MIFDEDEGTPLYLNGGGEGKLKWTLAQGVGPPTLELDKSKSGRVYKPTLRQFDIPIEPHVTFFPRL